MGKSRQETGTKADRKFEKKLQFYAKVRDTVATLSASKSITKKKKLRSRQKKLKAYDMSSLSDVLPELKAIQQKTTEPNFKPNPKNRNKILLAEREKMMKLLDNPTLEADPFAALNEKFLAMLPVVDPKNSSKKGEKKAKGKKKKASTGPKPMTF